MSRLIYSDIQYFRSHLHIDKALMNNVTEKYVLLLSPNYDWYATKQERVLLLMLVLSWKLFPDVLL